MSHLDLKTVGDNKWGAAKVVAIALKDKLAEVIIIALFLGIGAYVSITIGRELVMVLREVSTSMNSMKEALILNVTQSRYDVKARADEHNSIEELLKDLRNHIENTDKTH